MRHSSQRPEYPPLEMGCRARLLFMIVFTTLFAATCWLVGTALRAAT